MFAIVSLLIITALSLLITRIATVALTATGMSRESARFQARSALTGSGFTTYESESMVNHPVRRRIAMTLMLLGNVGLASIIATLIGGFARIGSAGQGLNRAIVLVIGLFALLQAAKSRWVDRRLSGLIRYAVNRFTDLDVRDYAGMLRLSGDYAVSELFVERGEWIADTPLAGLDLPHEGVLVLGIVRADGTYLGAPTGATAARPGDTLVVYGRVPVLAELDNRSAGREGERAHARAVAEQQDVERTEPGG